MVPSENGDDHGAGTRSCVVTLTVQRLAIAAPMGVGSTGIVIIEIRANLESVEACGASCTASEEGVLKVLYRSIHQRLDGVPYYTELVKHRVTGEG